MGGSHVVVHPVDVRLPSPRRVEQRRHRPLDVAVLDVGNDADDLDIERVAPEAHELPHGALTQVELLHEGLVHHGDLGRPPSVRRGELPAGPQLDTQRREVAGAHLVPPRVPVHIKPGWEPLHVDVGAPGGPGQKGDPRAGDARDAGDRSYLVLHAVVQQQGASAVVAAPFGCEAERDHVVYPDPQIDSRHID